MMRISQKELRLFCVNQNAFKKKKKKKKKNHSPSTIVEVFKKSDFSFGLVSSLLSFCAKSVPQWRRKEAKQFVELFSR